MHKSDSPEDCSECKGWVPNSHGMEYAIGSIYHREVCRTCRDRNAKEK